MSPNATPIMVGVYTGHRASAVAHLAQHGGAETHERGTVSVVVQVLVVWGNLVHEPGAMDGEERAKCE